MYMAFSMIQNISQENIINDNEFYRVNNVVIQLHDKVDEILSENSNHETYEVMNALNNNFIENSVNFNDEVFHSVFVNFNKNRELIQQELYNEKLDIENLNKVFKIREKMGKRILKNLDISNIENAINFNNNVYI
ncbi:hypothetical protein CD122_11705, partial [Staphylococcus rostri]